MRPTHHQTHRPHHIATFVVVALLAGCATPTPEPLPESAPPRSTTKPAPVEVERAPSAVTQRLRDEAAALAPLATSALGREFLRATNALPAQASRSVLQDPMTRDYFSAQAAAALPEARRSKLVPVVLDESRYYFTKYGSSLAYLRALDLAATQGPGLSGIAGKRVLDFGYGAITHLRLLASLGAHTTGVDPDSYLDALYSDAHDQGTVSPAAGLYRGAAGSVSLVHSRWPKDKSAIDRVARNGPFDLIISKNTLKRGYIKPERPANKRQLIDLGVSDDAFLKSLYDALAPGGLVMIYNISPKPSAPDKPFLPWSDGRSPYSRDQYAKAGFRVIAIDIDDSAMIRQIGGLLRWDKDAAGQTVDDLSSNLFAHYTIVQRP